MNPKSEEQYQRVFDAWSAGEHAFALELSRELFSEFPDYHTGRLLQGVILCGLARYQEAEEILNDAIQNLPPETLDYGYIQLGHLHRKCGRFEEVEKWYRQAIELDPNDAGRHIFLGALLAKKGDLTGAEASHRRATQCSSGCIDEAYLNLGLVLRAQEHYGEALQCFEKALELTPDYQEAHEAKSDLEKAIKFLDTVEQDDS
jgi:tetratricopeptide (TPR) repeat protein